MKNMTKEELELLPYQDIAYMLLKEKKEQTTLELFEQIISKLELPQSTLENKIGDFYTTITTDQRFIMLDSGKWDLKENHPTKNMMIEEDIEDIEEYNEDEYDKEKDEMYLDDTEDLEDVEEYKNLVIIDEDELENAE